MDRAARQTEGYDDEYLGYNLRRARARYIPASTFKVFNSLVALELGAERKRLERLHRFESEGSMEHQLGDT